MTEPNLLEEAENRLRLRKLSEAMQIFNRAQAEGLDPDRCAGGRWLAHMLGGNFAPAWNESDAIRARGRSDPHRFWNGEDLAGKRVMVRCLHGFGDAVQMFRYAPLLRRACHRQVIFEVPPRLFDIARCFDGVDDVITWGEQAPAHPPDWDVQLEIMELPYIFRTTLHELPLAEKYLHLPPLELAAVARSLGERRCRRVGLVWSAGEWNTARSVPPDLLRPLLAQSGCEFWNLQGGAARATLGGMREVDACRDGILPLAAVIAQLDLIITVDTLAAHLAGALGTPAWVMLQYAADWRWLEDREDSPWYPSLRLFRQPSEGDWASVVERIQASLLE